MSERTLKFGDVVVNKKEFHASNQPIDLSLADKIVVSEKFKCSYNGSKCFIGYLNDYDDNTIRPLFIILPQMS